MVDTEHVVREAWVDTSSRLATIQDIVSPLSGPFIKSTSLHPSRGCKSPFMSSPYPLATKLAFLPWLRETTTKNIMLMWRLGCRQLKDSEESKDLTLREHYQYRQQPAAVRSLCLSSIAEIIPKTYLPAPQRESSQTNPKKAFGVFRSTRSEERKKRRERENREIRL